jgi:hypothetical protein
VEKLEEIEAELAHGLVRRLSLHRWLDRFPARPVWAGFMFVSGVITIGVLAAVAKISRTPLVFPSIAINHLAGINYSLWSSGVPVRVLEPRRSKSAPSPGQRP